MAEEREELPYFTKVEIGGRTMLAPGFSLVGLTGIVWMRSPEAPAGCATVLVDWLSHGYTPENGYAPGSLPECVNVPEAHLTVYDPEARERERLEAEQKEAEQKAAAQKKASRPKLKVVAGEEKIAEKSESANEASNDPKSDGEKPRLRLV